MTVRASEFVTECGLDRDAGDAWGSTMSLLFGIADALTHADETVPSAWEYRHAPGCDALSPDEDYDAIAITAAIDSRRVSWEDARHAGDVLNRYSHVLERAGRSY